MELKIISREISSNFPPKFTKSLWPEQKQGQSTFTNYIRFKTFLKAVKIFRGLLIFLFYPGKSFGNLTKCCVRTSKVLYPHQSRIVLQNSNSHFVKDPLEIFIFWSHTFFPHKTKMKIKCKYKRKGQKNSLFRESPVRGYSLLCH